MNQDTQTTFSDSSFEETALAFILKDPTTYQDQQNKLESTLFEDRKLKALWDSSLSYYERYQGLIDDRGLEVLLDEAKVAADKKAEYQLLFAKIKSRSVSQSQFTLAVEQLKQLKQKRHLFDLATEIASALKSSTTDVDKLSTDVISKVFGLKSSATPFREISLTDSLATRQAEYADREKNPQKYLGIPFGIKKLDELTAGIFPEEFGIFFGRSGTGKSRTLASIAYNMFSRGNNVMYVTIEMPMSQVGRLFDSRHFLISSSGLRHGRLTDPDKKKYFTGNLQGGSGQGDFYVVDAPQGCTFSDLLPVIRKYKARKPLHAVVIDYMNLMTPATRNVQGNESLLIGTIGKELKGLARLEQIAVLTATTATRATAEIDNVDDVGTEHVGWSDLLVYQADLLVFLKKSDATQALAKQVDAVVVKYRDGSNQRLTLGADWDRSFVGDMDTYLKLVGAMVPNQPSPQPVVVSEKKEEKQQVATVPGAQK